ncbi:MAG: hypothetical protein GF370_00375 [Candidatus Nealsonbacteria bacterium]|nr:hypothetical protein [Candidatus Nealsonbacteria bacterium]
MSVIFKEGRTGGGKTFQILKSRDSCLKEGIHGVCVLPVGDDGKLLEHEELTLKDMAEAFIESVKFCRIHSEKDRWKLVLNGPGLLKSPWFHIHNIMPSESPQILREVWRPTDHLEKLKTFGKKLPPALQKEFEEEIIKGFEKNLK